MLYVGGDPIFTHFFNLISLNNFKFFISLRSVNWFECLFRVFESPIFFFFFLSVHSTYHLWSLFYHILTQVCLMVTRSCLRKLRKMLGLQCRLPSYVNTWEYFKLTKLEEESEQSINPNVGVWDILVTMHAMLGLFKTFTNFILFFFWKISTTYAPNHYQSCKVHMGAISHF